MAKRRRKASQATGAYAERVRIFKASATKAGWNIEKVYRKDRRATSITIFNSAYNLTATYFPKVHRLFVTGKSSEAIDLFRKRVLNKFLKDPYSVMVDKPSTVAKEEIKGTPASEQVPLFSGASAEQVAELKELVEKFMLNSKEATKSLGNGMQKFYNLMEAKNKINATILDRVNVKLNQVLNYTQSTDKTTVETKDKVIEDIYVSKASRDVSTQTKRAVKLIKYLLFFNSAVIIGLIIAVLS